MRKLKAIIFRRKNILLTGIFAVFAVNCVGYLGAYFLTNYRQTNRQVGSPRPVNKQTPTDFQLQYVADRLKIDRQEWIDIWTIELLDSNPKGTVILFHGKGSTKSSLLASAKVFHHLGYKTVLVDFRGSGGSSGNVTTVGVGESEDVSLVFNRVREFNPDRPIILYGISMGTAAILRAIAKENINPNAIILELPFTRLLSAVRTRLKNSRLPSFPMAESIVFWGGVRYGFNGFAHNPIDYVKEVNCPTLILQGNEDPTVNIEEVKDLYLKINSLKKMVVFPEAGHQLLVTIDKKIWQESVSDFLGNFNIKSKKECYTLVKHRRQETEDRR